MGSDSRQLTLVRLTRTETNSLHLQLPISSFSKTTDLQKTVGCCPSHERGQLRVNFTLPRKYYNYKLIYVKVIQGGPSCAI